MWELIKKAINGVVGKVEGAKLSEGASRALNSEGEEEQSEQKKQVTLEIVQANFEIVEVLSPYGKLIRCAKRGSIYIPIDKIAVFGTGKVKNLTAEEAIEMQRLDDERTGRKSPQAQREFSKNKVKKRRLKALIRKRHNYDRSQGNRKALLTIGMDPDSLEDMYKIIEHLLTEAEKMGVENMEVNEKVLGHSSRIEGPLDRMKIYSTWGMKSGSAADFAKLFYLETFIYSAR